MYRKINYKTSHPKAKAYLNPGTKDELEFPSGKAWVLTDLPVSSKFVLKENEKSFTYDLFFLSKDLPVIDVDSDNPEQMTRNNAVDCIMSYYSKTLAIYPDKQVKCDIQDRGYPLGDKTKYNIDLDNKLDLLGTGKRRQWSLMGNWDTTDIREKLSFDLFT